ncbi:MAG: riboflavin synthase [Synergistaceae bacterium]|nr:riboflavin synthase [Synergistaceae bacterium]
MFTGIIETVGTVLSVQPKTDVFLFSISAPKISGELKLGDSVSIDGACSTVTRQDLSSFSVEIMNETLNRTKFSKLKSGSRVNLERAMLINARLNGHIVTGHIDETAVVFSIEDYGKTRKYTFSASPQILYEIVPKGSIAIDGISLTVIHVDENSFSVGLIPTTLADTTIIALNKGDTVNIETDVLGKYVMKFLNIKQSQKNSGEEMKSSMTWDKLNNYGWT